MTLTMDGWITKMLRPDFPRSAKYEPAWVLENSMGPHVLWLTEALTQAMDLRAGMRILDIGCGKAVSSIFLAKEFGVRVWAFDLWIPAHENMRRVSEWGLLEKVFPLQGEAHALPFQEGLFDAIVSVDAFHYWGTEEGYLAYLLRFAKNRAQIGILVPGVVGDFELEELPELYREPTFKSADWWRKHWEASELVEIERAEALPDGWKIWADGQVKSDLGTLRGEHPSVKWSAPLEEDAGRTMAMVMVVARKRAKGGPR